MPGVDLMMPVVLELVIDSFFFTVMFVRSYALLAPCKKPIDVVPSYFVSSPAPWK